MPATESTFYIARNKKVQLCAVLHETARKSDKLIIMAHGYTGSKQECGRLFVMAARQFAEQGFSVLRFDFYGSGDSTGNFSDMSCRTEIADLNCVLDWAQEKGWKRIGLVGFSWGGAVSICTAAQRRDAVDVLVTWSAVPSLYWWHAEKEGELQPKKRVKSPFLEGPQFFTDRPDVDVPESYLSLTIPKLQVQGDNDLAEFRERFSEYFPKAQGVKKHVVIAGADHVFSAVPHRVRALKLTGDWFVKYL